MFMRGLNKKIVHLQPRLSELWRFVICLSVSGLCTPTLFFLKLGYLFSDAHLFGGCDQCCPVLMLHAKNQLQPNFGVI